LGRIESHHIVVLQVIGQSLRIAQLAAMDEHTFDILQRIPQVDVKICIQVPTLRPGRERDDCLHASPFLFAEALKIELRCARLEVLVLHLVDQAQMRAHRRASDWSTPNDDGVPVDAGTQERRRSDCQAAK
jgi:hypothetical protein